MRALVIAMTGLVAATSLTSSVRAQTPLARHALRWTRGAGADGCIDPSALRAAVEARLRRTVFVDGPVASIVIEAHVVPAAVGWHVTIAVGSAGGVSLGARELDEPAPDCRAVDDALALVIALIVDPDAASAAASPPPAPRPAPWGVAVAVAGAAAAGVLPGAAAGGTLAVTIDAPRMPPVMIRAGLWFEDEATAGAAGARFGLTTAGVAVCPQLWRRGSIAVTGCGGGELGRITARGFGFDRSHRVTALTGSALVEPRIAVRLRRSLEVQAGAGVWIPVVRPRFTFDQGGTPVVLYQAPVVAVVGVAGIGLHF